MPFFWRISFAAEGFPELIHRFIYMNQE